MKAKSPKKNAAPRRAEPNEPVSGFQAVEDGTPFVLAPGVKDLPLDQWTPVFFLPGYEVSNDGRVRKTGGRHLNPKMGDDGYLMVTVQVPLHVLVANSWLPNPEHLDHVRHKDGSRTHNHFLNLEFTEQNPDA